MAKKPEAMDAREQAVAALELAATFDNPVAFNAAAVPVFTKLGAAQIVEAYRQAHGLDPRTGDAPKPAGAPDTAVAGTLAGRPVPGIG